MAVSPLPSQGVRRPGNEPSDVLVKRLFARISEVSSLPAVAVRIVEVANDPKTEAFDLLEAVEFNAALAMRIMRTVWLALECVATWSAVRAWSYSATLSRKPL